MHFTHSINQAMTSGSTTTRKRDSLPCGSGAQLLCSAQRTTRMLSTREETLSLGYLPVFTDLTELQLGPIQFREVLAWAKTIHRSRPPFPNPGAPFGPFDKSLHHESLNATVGQLETFRITGISAGLTTLFHADLTPRHVSMDQTRRLGEQIVKGQSNT